jgi:aminopeptidase N
MLPKDAPDRELVNFFETWVYGTGLPHLELTSTVKGVAPRKVLELRLKQTLVPEDFALDVPVEIQLPRGQKSIRWMRSGPEDDVLEIPFAGAVPPKVLLDPRGTILKR